MEVKSGLFYYTNDRCNVGCHMDKGMVLYLVQDFDISIWYHKGSMDTIADALNCIKKLMYLCTRKQNLTF